MSKKITLSIALSLVACWMAVSLAFAQAEPATQPPGGGRRGVGQILFLEADRFSLSTRADRQQTFYVNESTLYRNAQGYALSYDDLNTGQWTAVTAWPSREGLLVAHLVVLLPDDYDPSQRLGYRAAGTIASVGPVASAFRLHTRRGETLTVLVNENTIYKGGVTSFDELQPGMLASVGALEQDDGSLLALVVLARLPLVQHAGEIGVVDPAIGAFELQSRAGETLLIAVDEQTRYRSRDGTIQSLGDLQPGMLALVMAKKDAEGQFIAVVVAAGTKDQLPQFDLRISGRVVSMGDDGFILRSPDGEQYSLIVTGETQFRSLRGRVKGLDEITPGMLLFVGADRLDDGSYEARVVAAGRRFWP